MTNLFTANFIKNIKEFVIFCKNALFMPRKLKNYQNFLKNLQNRVDLVNA